MQDGLLNVLAFFFRSTAFFVLVMLYLYFRHSSGKLVRPIRQVIAAFAFLLAWVWVASLAEVVMWWPHAGQLIEYSTSWIWVPNAVITVFLVQLLVRLYLRDPDDVA